MRRHSAGEKTTMFERLTFRSVNVRPVIVPLRRPVVSKVGLFDQWPIILIDIETEEGITGRSYLEPYLKASARAIAATITISLRRAPGSRSGRWRTSRRA
jgi:mandelate racemase